jgi:hypothetical protein
LKGPGYAGGAAGFTRRCNKHRRLSVGQEAHPASLAKSDESCREESNKFKEAGGAQDDLSHEEDNDMKMTRTMTGATMAT